MKEVVILTQKASKNSSLWVVDCPNPTPAKVASSFCVNFCQHFVSYHEDSQRIVCDKEYDRFKDGEYLYFVREKRTTK